MNILLSVGDQSAMTWQKADNITIYQKPENYVPNSAGSKQYLTSVCDFRIADTGSQTSPVVTFPLFLLSRVTCGRRMELMTLTVIFPRRCGSFRDYYSTYNTLHSVRGIFPSFQEKDPLPQYPNLPWTAGSTATIRARTLQPK